MNFLAPAFLAALSALAIPVAIHLVNRERREVVPFPSLMFLQKISYRSVRRQKLRHLVLLAMRCLAVAIIVAAFARPFFRRSALVSAAAGRREVVVLLDRSYSMAYGDRWARATDAVRQAVSGVGRGDQASLITFDESAEVAAAPGADVRQLTSRLVSLRPGDGGTRYAPALRLAEGILAASTLPRKDLVVISDFQRRGWERPEEIALPASVHTRAVDVSGRESGDAAVTSVTTTRDSARDRPVLTVVARLTNTAPAPVSRPVALQLDGREVQRKTVTIPAAGSTQIVFAPAAVPNGIGRGVVQLGPPADAQPKDDAYRFIIAPDAARPVLVIEPANARPDQSLFLSRALALAERPAFHVDVKRSDALTAAQLDGRALVILDEASFPSGAVGARLRSLVADGSGAGLLVVAGAAAAPPADGRWRAVLPADIGPVIDRNDASRAGGGATLATIDYAQPVFERFAAPHSGDFSAARFLRYRTLRPHAEGVVSARFDDGSPALVERSVGRGRIAIWASTLDAYWNDLPLQPVFLPFVDQLAKHLGAFENAREAYTVGDVADLGRDSASELLAPDGTRRRVAGDSGRSLITLNEQGFYEIRRAGAAPGAGAIIAVNVDPREADLAHMDPKELFAAVAPRNPPAVTRGGTATGDFAEEERSQTLWWYLLLGAMMLLAAETVMSNRLSRAG